MPSLAAHRDNIAPRDCFVGLIKSKIMLFSILGFFDTTSSKLDVTITIPCSFKWFINGVVVDPLQHSIFEHFEHTASLLLYSFLK